MTTKVINLYSFQELSEDAKKNAINELRDLNVDHQWWECTYEDALNIGVKITGFNLDRANYCNGDFTLSACEVAANIMRDHGHTCETYKTTVSFMEDWQPVFNDYMNEDSDKYESMESENLMQDMEDEFLKSLLEDYRIILSNEYEYLISDEAIIETIECNEYLFTEDGQLE